MVASQLGAHGADVILACAAAAARGFQTKMGCGNAWKLPSPPRGVQCEAEEGSVLADPKPFSVHFSKDTSLCPEDVCSQVTLLGTLSPHA